MPHDESRRPSRDLPALAVLLAVVAIGTLCLWANAGLPIVRNSLVYARAAEHVAAHGGDPRPVVADSRLSYDKPIGFAWLAAARVERFGPNLGLELSSWIGTVFFALATLFALRVWDPYRLSPGERALALGLALVNPLTAYQFWSAHPDSLFAAAVLLCFALAHRLATAPRLLDLCLLVLLTCAALLIKNYALILLASVPLTLAWHARAPATRAHARALLGAKLVGLALCLGWAAWAWSGHHPLARLEGEGGGVGQYGRGALAVAAGGALLQLALTLALNLHVGLLAALRAPRALGPAVPALACFALPYVLGLLPFPTSYYNMRYLLPLLPVAAVVCVAASRRLGTGARRAWAAGSLAAGAALLALFNSAPLYARVGPSLPEWKYPGYGAQSMLDNLRMKLHLEQAAWLDALNESVPPGAVLYLVDVVYYRDAQHGVYERAGLIRSDIETRYVSSRELAPAEAHFFVYDFLGRLRDLDRFGAVRELGHGLYEVGARAGG